MNYIPRGRQLVGETATQTPLLTHTHPTINNPGTGTFGHRRKEGRLGIKNGKGVEVQVAASELSSQ